MLFASYLGAIEAIARLGEKATVGEIQKMNSHLTRGQMQRVLNGLMGEGYVNFTTVKYGRTGKKVYYVTDRCVVNVSIVGRAVYDVESTMPIAEVA